MLESVLHIFIGDGWWNSRSASLTHLSRCTSPGWGPTIALELLACQSLHIVETFTDEDVARLKVFYQSRVDLCFYLWTACMST